jgi:hypothetical protein
LVTDHILYSTVAEVTMHMVDMLGLV